ncbi:MAG: alpha-glucan family phosphorylase [Bacteroidia bacterium]
MLSKGVWLIEISWEVANKVGGIYTVIVGKRPVLSKTLGAGHLFIGPWLGHKPKDFDFLDRNPYEAFLRYFRERTGAPLYVGRWCHTTTFLVDFQPFMQEKDHFFYELWESFDVDSLTGGWDYIEPALFGLAAGKVVEAFYHYFLEGEATVIAQFHEWLTGSGVLYLRKKLPGLPTVFTTHATVVGRAYHGVYPAHQNPEFLASQAGVLAKHSLEKRSAQYAHVFTTVSEIVAQEAQKLLERMADVITPNGWTVPPFPASWDLRKSLASLWKASPPADALWVFISGRYEVHNKGIDAFLEALAQWAAWMPHDKVCVAGFLLPLQRSARVEIREKENFILTHPLPAEKDYVQDFIQDRGLHRAPNLRLLYVPVYIDGEDGLWNVSYYEMVQAWDAGCFPSLYEPWGYTPMESLGLGRMTLTTNHAGFGLWAQKHLSYSTPTLAVIDRQDPSPAYAARQIFDWLSQAYAQRSMPPPVPQLSWENFIDAYHKAYELALYKAAQQKQPPILTTEKAVFSEYRSRLYVRPKLPEVLQPLHELAYNLWYSWQPKALKLWHHLGYEAFGENPVALLNAFSASQWAQVASDDRFLAQLKEVYQEFQAYMRHEPAPVQVAYFCMEYGLTPALPLYSGGLGVLAGDYLKEASDQNYPLVGVGLLYRKGYFIQRMSALGSQVADAKPLRFTDLPIVPLRDERGLWVKVSIPLGSQTVYAKAFEVKVGRVSLYLLDTDIPENSPPYRDITDQLYGGDAEHRFLQEWILGYGGHALLEVLGHRPLVYHYNEGHPAFGILWRYAKLRQEGHPNPKEFIRQTTVFTTHTPVAAGHDRFSPHHLRPYLASWMEEKGIPWEEFWQWGKDGEEFSLSFFCAHFAGKINGVSRLHGQTSRRIFQVLFPAYVPEELPITHVTNGVHIASWDKIGMTDPSPDQMWQKHLSLKQSFLAWMREYAGRKFSLPPAYVRAVYDFVENTTPEMLWVGFARRMAAYKRAYLLFQDLDALGELLEGTQPLRIWIAGKAHPRDNEGQNYLEKIWRLTLEPPLRGKVLFLPDYNLSLAHRLIPAMDVWLNTPIYPMEASGTSGMKASLNGVLHLSIRDGWWAEAPPEIGWSIPSSHNPDPDLRDAWENAQLIYLLRQEIRPLFYQKEGDFSLPWVQKMLRARQVVRESFSTYRMLQDYDRLLYQPLFTMAPTSFFEELRQWEKLIQKEWSSVQVISWEMPDVVNMPLEAGEPFSTRVRLNVGSFPPQAIHVEVLFWKNWEDEPWVFPLEREEEGVFVGTFHLPAPGVYHFALRCVPVMPSSGYVFYTWARLIFYSQVE